MRTDTSECIILFLNFVARRSNKAEFEVSNNIAEQYLSRFKLKNGKNTRLLPLLRSLGIIEKVRSHSTDAHQSCRYKFTLGPLKGYSIRLNSKQAIYKIQNSADRKAKALSKYVERSWINESLMKSELPVETLELLSRKRGKNNKQEYKRVAQKIKEGEFCLSSKNGRFHSVYSQIPSEYRQEIRISGEQVTRLDLSASHLHMLCKYMSVLVDNGKSHRNQKLTEIQSFRDNILSSEDAYASILPGTNRKKAKIAVNTFLNKRDDRYPREVVFALKKHMPLMANTLKNHKDPIGPILQAYERDLILKVVRRLKDFNVHVIPVTDEILVPHTKRQVAIEIFREEVELVSGVLPKVSGV